MPKKTSAKPPKCTPNAKQCTIYFILRFIYLFYYQRIIISLLVLFILCPVYESTETFDIKGLTYNNSGNVQIEILCEKPGYLPQKKVFNLRTAIDQKSINAHFTLVKDEY